MSSESERDRIAAAYSRYDARPAEQAKRDMNNRGNRAIERERDKAMMDFLLRPDLSPLGNVRVLDVGCGNGTLLAKLLGLGFSPANMAGCDILADRIASARTRLASLVRLDVNEVDSLPYETDSFDLAVAFTVFSSILSTQVARKLANEIRRVVRSGGFVLWYDSRYPNPRNPDVKAVDRAEIRELFPKAHLDLRAVTLVPPLARRFGPMTNLIYPIANRLPPLRVRYLGLIQLP